MDIESLVSAATIVAPFLGGGAVVIVMYAKRIVFLIKVVQQTMALLESVTTPNSELRQMVEQRGDKELIKALDGGVAKIKGLSK